MIRTSDTAGKVLFEERQQFPQWLILVLILPVMVIVGVFMASGIYMDGTPGTWMLLFAVILLQFLMIYYFSTTRLEKLVTDAGFFFRWKPFQKKYRFIPSNEIETFRIRKCPMVKYGSGYFPGFGRYHKLSDGKGIQLLLTDGKKIFFSTSDELFFRRAMEKIATPAEPTFD